MLEIPVMNFMFFIYIQILMNFIFSTIMQIQPFQKIVAQQRRCIFPFLQSDFLMGCWVAKEPGVHSHINI